MAARLSLGDDLIEQRGIGGDCSFQRIMARLARRARAILLPRLRRPDGQSEAAFVAAFRQSAQCAMV